MSSRGRYPSEVRLRIVGVLRLDSYMARERLVILSQSMHILWVM